MSILIKTRKMLWGRSANRCNFPECRCELVMDESETDDASVVGEECHIVARENNGPRGNSVLTEEQRDKYNNLILMCSVHHKLIDDQPNKYTIEILKQMKKDHEQWVNRALSLDSKKQKDDEVYSLYADQWCKLIDIDNWRGWSSYLLGSGQPSISKEMDENLNILRVWLLNRVWPKRYNDLENAFENFRIVLESLSRLFHKHSNERAGMIETVKFYKIDRWDEELYERLFKEFEFHVYLVEDLVVELTRAANYVCDKIREFLLPSFRIDEGLLLVTYGPCMDFNYKTIRAEYGGVERISIPYPGLEKFKEIREDRDFNFSVGVSIEDPKFIDWYNNYD